MGFQGSTSLKFFKTLNIYKNSTGTVRFDPKTKTGYSYNWKFVGEVKGVLVFNDYRWSNTTNGHQTAVRGVLRELDLKYIVGDFGRRDVDMINVKDLYKKIAETELDFESSRKDTQRSNWLAALLSDQLRNLEALKQIGLKISEKEKIEIRKQVFEKHLEQLNETEYYKSCKAIDTKEALTNLIDPVF